MNRRRIDRPDANRAAAIWTGDYIKIRHPHKCLTVTHDEDGRTHYSEAGQIWKEYEYLRVDWQNNNGTIKARDFKNRPAWTHANKVLSIWPKE